MNKSGPSGRSSFVDHHASLLVVVCLLIVSFLACAQQETPTEIPVPSGRSAVILVPGYYGTRLVRVSDGKLIWISALQAVFGNVPLTLPIPGLGLHDAVPLRSDGILERVNVVPLLYSVNGYGSMLKALQDYGRDRVAVVPFAYDWRDDVMVNVKKLARLIESLRASGTTDIRLVAHSMGGLMTAYYLRYGAHNPNDAVETWEGADRVDRVALVAVPYQGTMVAFRNSQYGVKIGLNRTLLQPTAVASFPATYYLLPAMDTDVLITPQLTIINGPVRTERNWADYRWGLLRTSSGNEFDARREAYTSAWLSRSQAFSSRLLAPSDTTRRPGIPLLSISGTGVTTLATGVWDRAQPDDARALLFEPGTVAAVYPGLDPGILFADGDGTVTTGSASLPLAYSEAFDTTVRTYRIGHAELMTWPDVQQDIVEFVKKGQIW